MSKITGEHIPDIAPDLSEEDLAVIWKQLVETIK